MTLESRMPHSPSRSTVAGRAGDAPARSSCFYGCCGAVGLVVLLTVAGLLFMGRPGAAGLLKENGPIEMMSAAGYVVAVVFFLIKFRRSATALWYFPLLMLAMGLRELDFHVRFTTINMTKARYFFTEGVPPGEKAVVAAVLLVLACAGVTMLVKEGRAFWTSLKQRQPAGVGVSLAIMLGVCSLVLDALPRKLLKWGITVSDFPSFAISVLEEVVELGIPLMLLVTIAFVRAPIPKTAVDQAGDSQGQCVPR